jgi:hypothetical protein
MATNIDSDEQELPDVSIEEASGKMYRQRER